MGRPPIVILLSVLFIAPAMLPPAGADVQGPPDWRVGDRWEYRVAYQSPLGTTYGNLSREVTAVGPVRVGNRTVDAYTLGARQTYMGHGVNSSSTSTIIVSRSDLGTLSVDTASTSSYGELRSTARTVSSYNPSKGHYRFPLGVGTNWSVEYNLTRTMSPGEGENRTVYGQCTCEAIDSLSVGAGRFRAYRVTCTLDSGNVSTYWYSEGVRGEVQMQEMDRGTGALTIYTLKRYVRAQEPFPLLGSDTGRAILLGIVSVALLLSALALVLVRHRASRPARTQDAREQAVAPGSEGRPGAVPQARPGTMELACPACKRRFKVPSGTKEIKCPFCGKQGSLG